MAKKKIELLKDLLELNAKAGDVREVRAGYADNLIQKGFAKKYKDVKRRVKSRRQEVEHFNSDKDKDTGE